MRSVPTLLLTVLLAVPSLAAIVGAAGTPSADPTNPTRLLGGEVLALPFDARDLDTSFAGSVADRSPAGAIYSRSCDPPVIDSPGGQGTAFAFNNCAYLTANDVSGINTITSSFSFTTWIRLQDVTSSTSRAVFGAAYGNGNQAFLMLYAYQGRLYVYLDDSLGTTRQYDLGVSLAAGGWDHVAFTYHDLVLTTYLNGNLVGSQTTNPLPYKGSPVVSARVGLGTCCFAGYFSGVLDEVRLYNRSLSGAEISSIKDLAYTAPNTPPVANAGGPYAAGCGPDGLGRVTLDGRASSDANGDALTYAWSAPDARALSAPTSALTDATFGMGAHTATLTVSDGQLSSSATAVVQVADGTPPVLSNVTPVASGVYAAGTFVATPTGGPIAVASIDATADANDPCTGVARVAFQLDGAPPVVLTHAPYAVSFPIDGVGVSYHTLRVTATDGAGNVSPAVTSTIAVIAAAPRAPS